MIISILIAALTIISGATACDITTVYANVGPPRSMMNASSYTTMQIQVTGGASGIMNVVGVYAGTPASVNVPYSASTVQL